MAGKFVLKKSKKGFMFNLKASNGQIILTSESYTEKAGAMNGIASVQKNGGDQARFDVKKAKNGETYFVLKAGNDQIIGKSEMYSSPDGCKRGVKSVMTNAPTAPVVDESGE